MMIRNRDCQNQLFSKEIIDMVWEKAEIVPGYVSELYRKDKCGAWIAKNLYGESYRVLSYGWEIDHIIPKSMGGSDDISNLQPLHWENNRKKGESYPEWFSLVSCNEGANSYDIRIRTETIENNKKTIKL